MPAEPLVVATAGHVAVVTVERPDLLDQLDATALDAARRIVATVGDDPAVRCLLLSWPDDGSSNSRVALLPGETVSGLLGRVHAFNALLLDLVALSKPTVSAIAGGLTGITCNLALSCDFRVAAEGASLGQGYLKSGLPPHGGASYLWPEMAGLGRANEVLLGGATLNAVRAQQYRLVTQVVSAAELEAAALGLGTDLAGAAPVAIALAKGLAHARRRDELEAQLEAESYAVVSALFDGAAKGV